MPRRVIEVDGGRWEVTVSGRTTQYVKDEFGLRAHPGRWAQSRAAGRSLLAAGRQGREVSLGQLSDAELRDLLGHSQPSWTAPEMGYRR